MSRLRRVIVMLLVAGLVAQPLIAPVAAAGDEDGFAGDPCGRDVIQISIDMLQGNLDKSTECRIQEILDGSDEQEMQDIHAQAETLSVSSDSYTDGVSNSLENARTVAWTKAEVATLNALENNSTQEETRIAARNAVRDYYSRMLQNVVADRNSKLDEVYYLISVRDNQSLASETIRREADFADDTRIIEDWNGDSMTRYEPGLIVREGGDTVALPNGSTVNLTHFDASTSSDNGSTVGSAPFYTGFSNDYQTVEELRVVSTYNNSTVVAYNGSEYHNLIDEINAQNQQLLSNTNTTVNGLYGSYVRGELNVSEYQSVQAAAMDSSQDLDETGYSMYSVVALAQAGATVPDLNETGSITVTTSEFTANNTTEDLTGLMVGDPPDGSGNWTVGDTYDPANGNGTLTFHVEASNRSVILTEPFELTGATDKDGAAIQVVEGQKYNYETNDYSELGKKLDLLIELREEEQERIEAASSTSGGGLNWGGWPSQQELLAGGTITFLVLGGAAILVGGIVIQIYTP